MARKKKQEEAPKGSPAWMATFGDLMNLLLCFFVLLFSMSTVDAEKYEQLVSSLSSSFSIFEGGGSAIGEGILISSGVSQLNDLGDYVSENQTGNEEQMEDSDVVKEYEKQQEKLTNEMYEEIAEKVEKGNLESYIELTSNSPYVQINLNGAILFDSGKADIKKEAIPILSKVGDILKSYDDCQIMIEGHTDNIPISNSTYKNNLFLSTARACYVQEYLINEKNLNPETLIASGRAEYDPIASNATDEGRAKNRRVEIKIYNPLYK